MLIMHLCVRGIYVGHVFVCYNYRFWSCIFVLGVSMLVMCMCSRGIHFSHVFVCRGILVDHVFVC